MSDEKGYATWSGRDWSDSRARFLTAVVTVGVLLWLIGS